MPFNYEHKSELLSLDFVVLRFAIKVFTKATDMNTERFARKFLCLPPKVSYRPIVTNG